jgi:hypothetical protein
MAADMSAWPMLATLLFIVVATAEPEIIVRRSAAQPAIERILKADNLDVDALAPSEVAERMQDIQQGAAPSAFWQAYQAHVRAWTDYADALDPRSGGALEIRCLRGAIGRSARAEINRTFGEVEQFARRYGARLPLPRTRF